MLRSLRSLRVTLHRHSAATLHPHFAAGETLRFRSYPPQKRRYSRDVIRNVGKIYQEITEGAIFFSRQNRESMIYLRYPRGWNTNGHKRTGKTHSGRGSEFEAGLRSKVEQFEAAHAERKLTISVIETLWGESRKLSDEIIKQVYTELTNAGEEKLVQEKKLRSIKQE
jgi:hypothetical protein